MNQDEVVRVVTSRVGIAVIALVTFAPLSLAATHADGRLFLDAPIVVPGSGRSIATSQAAYFPEAEGISSWTLEAREVLVHSTTWNVTEVPSSPVRTPLVTSNTTATFKLDAVRGFQEGAEPGWVGIYYGINSAAADVLLDPPIRVENDASLGNSPNPEVVPDASVPSFETHALGAALRYAIHDSVMIQGDFAVKIRGLHVRLESAQNTTNYATGAHRQGTTPVEQRTESWIILSVTNGTMRFTTRGPGEALSSSLEMRWQGEGTFHATGGYLNADGSLLEARPGTGSLTGDLLARLEATTSETGRGITLSLSGELTKSTLSSSALRASTPWTLSSVWILGGVAILLVVMVAWSILARRRPAFTVDECRAMAANAAESSDPQTALDWTRRALKLAPSSMRLRLDEANFLEALGDHEAATERYRALSPIEPTGEASFLYARSLAFRGALVEAAAFLSDALLKSPALVMEVEDDAAFDGLRVEPAFARSIQEARRRLDAADFR